MYWHIKWIWFKYRIVLKHILKGFPLSVIWWWVSLLYNFCFYQNPHSNSPYNIYTSLTLARYKTILNSDTSSVQIYSEITLKFQLNYPGKYVESIAYIFTIKQETQACVFKAKTNRGKYSFNNISTTTTNLCPITYGWTFSPLRVKIFLKWV